MEPSQSKRCQPRREAGSVAPAPGELSRKGAAALREYERTGLRAEIKPAALAPGHPLTLINLTRGLPVHSRNLSLARHQACSVPAMPAGAARCWRG